jgi:hypothetical protein
MHQFNNRCVVSYQNVLAIVFEHPNALIIVELSCAHLDLLYMLFGTSTHTPQYVVHAHCHALFETRTTDVFLVPWTEVGLGLDNSSCNWFFERVLLFSRGFAVQMRKERLLQHRRARFDGVLHKRGYWGFEDIYVTFIEVWLLDLCLWLTRFSVDLGSGRRWDQNLYKITLHRRFKHSPNCRPNRRLRFARLLSNGLSNMVADYNRSQKVLFDVNLSRRS